MEELDRPFSFDLLCEVSWIRNGLSKYVELSQEIEKMLDQKQTEIGKELSDTIKDTPKQQHQDVYESYALDSRDYESTFVFCSERRYS
jgi:hypothetical protein